jgi:hypothetical protein
MKTLNELVKDYKDLSRDSSSANESRGWSLITSFINRILAMRDWTFNRGSITDKSEAGEWRYRKPYNAEKIIGIKVKVDDIDYWPKEISSRDVWERLSRTAVSSDSTQYFFVGDVEEDIEVYPVFSESNHDITIYYQKFIPSRSASDYAVGTVSRSAASRTVIGTGTTFDWYMTGKYIKFEADPYWVKIETFVNTTTLITSRESRTATDDGSYIISELVPLPSGFSDIPLHWALEVYFQEKENPTQAKYWQELRLEGLESLMRRDAKSAGSVLEKELADGVAGIVDPNQYPLDMA